MFPGLLIKTILPGLVTFIIGIAITPMVASFLYKHRLWKRRSRSLETTALPEDEMNPAFKAIHNEKAELNTPRVGGVIIWGSVLLTMGLFWISGNIFSFDGGGVLDFISRKETWLPIFTFIIGSLFGLFDDLLQIFGKGKILGEGIDRKVRIAGVAFIGALGAWWFFVKLGISSIAIPILSTHVELGWLFIPFFILTILATFSSSVIDGIDGLAGGVMMIIYVAFGIIAYSKGFYDVAALCTAISGGLLAFLWFNIPPARFYLGDTGMVGLTITLAIIAFITDSILLLPIIGLPLVATSISSFVQIISKRFFGKKIFKIAPLHHHFEAIGWPREKITMRYWVFTGVCAMLGVIIGLI